MKTLRELLDERRGHSTLTATLGTNGNGGMLADIDTLLDVDDEQGGAYLCGYAPANVEPGELQGHADDAGMAMHPNDDWRAWDCEHTDEQGYLTGAVSRIYVNLAL